MKLNLEAIRSQKIALGFVEVPACEQLRAHAARVPADQAIVEIGAYKGRSTGWLAWGSSEGNSAPVFSVDTWETRDRATWDGPQPGYVDNYSEPETRQAYEEHLDRTGIRPLVTPVCGWSTDVAKAWDGPKIGLLFHDAAHDRKSVRDDIKAFLKHMAKDAVILAHDVGNPAFGVMAGVEDALTGTKAAREKWDYEGREVRLWPKQPKKRGLVIVRTRP